MDKSAFEQWARDTLLFVGWRFATLDGEYIDSTTKTLWNLWSASKTLEAELLSARKQAADAWFAPDGAIIYGDVNDSQ